ncbi:MAG: adenylate/guanylate cyclase domain-containing protein [Deltaproteobacteria bacterium]|nr:adenylate/guanylate cyclase domain-containing protein [Deltaproteobacteria bacterium]MBI3390939.1 adenylate/guanylate cyclase domain-containing protein [Deltaproteobacteria bacterium]
MQPTTSAAGENIDSKRTVIERRLAAIMSGDVVGYSQLMAVDEDATVRHLRSSRECIGRLVACHHGRVVDFTGDCFLAEFPSVVAAANCTLVVQDALHSSNANLPVSRRMEFRLGLHLGEVRVEDGALYGTGVNIAARLQALAAPGGICVSQVVLREIASRVAVVCDDLGERSVKNIPEPIRVFRLRRPGSSAVPVPIPLRPLRRRIRRAALPALLALLIPLSAATLSAFAPGARWFGMRPASPAAIAVLPFSDMSTAQDEGYFAEGLVEQLTHALANVRSLRVAARTSAFAVTIAGRDARTIGHLLDAETIIEGSVRRAGNQLRVTVQAIRVADGYHLWSQIYDYEEADALSIQDEIARAVAETLSQQLAGEAGASELCGPGRSRPAAAPEIVHSEARTVGIHASAG